jgi:hypothetical protein
VTGIEPERTWPSAHLLSPEPTSLRVGASPTGWRSDLPVQLRHGARLIGRWEAEDGRVIAVWEYDDRDAYERINAAVRADPDSMRARQHRADLPPLITAQQETFMVSTTGEP